MKVCPKCGASNTLKELPQRNYRCGDCGLELAHLDTNAQGVVRGVSGWLLDRDRVVNERYQIVGVLGKGGFGATYLVDDLRLHQRRRALKEIPELLFDEHETRLLGRLNHPAIPDIIDRFTDAGMVYIVLEFGGSRTLRSEQERRGGRIPLFVLLPWIQQLCAAIAYLHAQDPPVVHRDLKPDNILLDDHDRVMLIDFGIAKEASPDTATRTLGRAASQGFSPPEQVLGTGTDERSDVYALGAIVYHLLTGTLPVAAYERVTGALLEPLSRILPDIPPAVDAAVLKALELNINLRQQTIAEFAEVFDQLAGNRNSQATIVVPPGHPLPGTAATPNSSALPSLRIPSVPLTGADPGAPLPTPAPPPRRRSSALLGAGLMLLLAAALGAGGVWWMTAERGTDPASPGPPAVAEQDRVPLPEPVAPLDPPLPSTPLPPGEEQAWVPPPEPVAPLDPPVDPPVVPPTVAGEIPALPGMTVDSGSAEQPTDAGSRPIAATPPPAVDTAAMTGTPEAAAPTDITLPLSSGASAGLPSIFSDEQAPLPARPAPTGSLMDEFDKHRATHQSAPAESPAPPAVAAPVAKPAPQPAARPATTASTRPAPPPPAKPPPPKPAPPPPARASGSGGASDWGFTYKGAEKQY